MSKRLFLAFIVLIIALLPCNASAATEEVKWLPVNIPAQGDAGNWMLAPGSDVRHLAIASDGVMYCYANPAGTTYRLFKSNDGRRWSSTGRVTGTIIDIATAPDNPQTVYYATASQVFRSKDSGETFNALPAGPGGAGAGNVQITSIAVAPLEGRYIVAAATRDTDSGQFGGVYILDEEPAVPAWQTTSLSGYDVYAVAFSPAYSGDRRLLAAATDETDTFIITRVAEGAWNASISAALLNGNNTATHTPVAVADSAEIAFPEGYSVSEDTLFVAISTGSEGGDIYKIAQETASATSSATDLDAGLAGNLDFTSIAVSGEAANAHLLAGAAGSAQVYSSTDGGRNWKRSTKQPTGQSRTYAAFSPAYRRSGAAYVATSGMESGFSLARDRSSWNQISLVDTTLTNISEFAVSPAYEQDKTIFLLTFGGEYSVWRSLSDGTDWERIYCSSLPNVDTITHFMLSPSYGSSGNVIFMAGTGGGTASIWKSTNSGQEFTRRVSKDPQSAASIEVNAWAAVNDDTLIVCSFNGTTNQVYVTRDSGWTYSNSVIAGSQAFNSVVLSPDYAQDKTMLAGSSGGWVYISTDEGKTFKAVPSRAASAPLTGAISVAFDPDFGKNRTIFAASAASGKSVYRFILDKSSAWENIDGTLPSASVMNQVIVSPSGVLYASNGKADSGMERCLDPTYPLGPTFETVTRGLASSAALSGLRFQSNRLWAIDTHNLSLVTFLDTMCEPPVLAAPLDRAKDIATKNTVLEWETVQGATEYKWQLDYDTDFTTVPAGFEGETKASSAHLPELDFGTEYYWRVRATEPVLSPWSKKRAFVSTLGSGTSAPQLLAPKAGLRGVAAQPVFQWSAVERAERYELIVAASPSFATPAIVKAGEYALPGTAWECDVSLNGGTTYYWKVRALGGNTASAWSAAGAFTTAPQEQAGALPQIIITRQVEPPPQPPLPEKQPTAPTTPAPPPDGIPFWAMLMFGGLVVVIILLAIAILLLVVEIRRF